MPISTTLILVALLQVGPNPAATDTLGVPEELANRPARPSADGIAPDPTSAWLQECLDVLDQDAARAHTTAQIRLTETTGADRVMANHCLGLASTELGRWEDAQSAFVAARDETPVDEVSTRARFAIMAGNAALGGSDAEQAASLLGAARIDAQQAANATLGAIAATDQARALVALNRSEQALEALESATTLEPEKAESWLLKATLLRRLDRLDDAQSAIERAGELAPMEGAIGLEAGVISVLSGREDAARRSWQSVIDTQPDSLAAQTAREYLDQIGPAPEPQSTDPQSSDKDPAEQ